MSTVISRLYTWVTDKTNGVKITASKMDAENDQLIASLNRKVLCSGSAPSSPIAGQTWVDTTNKLVKWYRNNEWVIIGIVHTSSSAPSTMQSGDVWIDSSGSENIVKVRNKANDAWISIPSTTGGILASYKNLRVVRGSVTQVTVTADEIVLEDSSNNKAVVRSFNKAAAITSSGAGGLDTGTEASATWYYIWAIRKSSDGTTNSLLSASASAPTMPSGYDQKALVSAVYNDGSSDFIDFIQQGKRYSYKVWRTMASGNVAAWTAITTTAFVPSSISDYCYGALGGPGNVMLTNDNAISSNQTGDAPNKYFKESTTNDLAHWQLDIITANTIYWGGSNASSIVYIHGFELNKVG